MGAELRPPARCYWITGIPAAGKTTLAHALADALRQIGAPALIVDGDELRQGLCRDLDLSDAARIENIRRAGEIAHLALQSGISAICSLVSPFRGAREAVRERIGAERFVEIYLSTPVAECARRDPKGLYARARTATHSGLTGFDAPYEPPASPDWVFDTTDQSADALALTVIRPLRTSLC